MESIKRTVPWSAHYYTKPQSYYPVPEHKVNLTISDVPKLKHPKINQALRKEDIEKMKSWATDHGKCVKQRTIRQETTKYKCGTLPLNMYLQKQKPVSELDKVNVSLVGHLDSASASVSDVGLL